MRDDESQDGAFKLEIAYERESPKLGGLAHDLREVDRGLRDALREARLGEEPSGRRGWPRLVESAEILKIEKRSPLVLVALMELGELARDVVVALATQKIAARLSSRPRPTPPIRVTIEETALIEVEVSGEVHVEIRQSRRVTQEGVSD